LYDYDPVTDAMPNTRLLEVDRYALSRYGEVASRVLHAYECYEFQAAVHTLNNYLTVDISAFYVDISKDRLYTFGPESHARRSAQTAIHIIVDGLTRLLAPILPVTCDELWRHLPGVDADSVHLTDFPTGTNALVDEPLLSRWSRLLKLREVVNGELEKLRQEKVVGTSLEATVTLTADGELAELLETYQDDLATLFITSDVSVHTGDAVGDDSDATVFNDPTGRARIEVHRVKAGKCPRCWRWVVPPGGAGDPDTTICKRCRDALATTVTTTV